MDKNICWIFICDQINILFCSNPLNIRRSNSPAVHVRQYLLLLDIASYPKKTVFCQSTNNQLYQDSYFPGRTSAFLRKGFERDEMLSFVLGLNKSLTINVVDGTQMLSYEFKDKTVDILTSTLIKEEITAENFLDRLEYITGFLPIFIRNFSFKFQVSSSFSDLFDNLSKTVRLLVVKSNSKFLTELEENELPKDDFYKGIAVMYFEEDRTHFPFTIINQHFMYESAGRIEGISPFITQVTFSQFLDNVFIAAESAMLSYLNSIHEKDSVVLGRFLEKLLLIRTERKKALKTRQKDLLDFKIENKKTFDSVPEILSLASSQNNTLFVPSKINFKSIDFAISLHAKNIHFFQTTINLKNHKPSATEFYADFGEYFSKLGVRTCFYYIANAKSQPFGENLAFIRKYSESSPIFVTFDELHEDHFGDILQTFEIQKLLGNTYSPPKAPIGTEHARKMKRSRRA